MEEAFPSLYSLASCRDAWVAQLWDQSGNLGHWNPLFTRLNNDWEMEEVETSFSRLHDHALRKGDENVMFWRVSKKGFFTVKSFFSSLVPCIGRAPFKLSLESLGSKEGQLFCFRGYLGKNSNYGSTKKEGLGLTK